jgi:hypothetical protein
MPVHELRREPINTWPKIVIWSGALVVCLAIWSAVVVIHS